MIAFRCPTCAQEYTVPVTNAGKRGKCKNCGEPLVVPEPDVEVLPADPDPGKVPGARSPARPTPGAAPTSRGTEPEPEPTTYKHAENVVRSLANVGGFFGVLGILVNLIAAGWAFTSRNNEGLGVVFLANTVVSLLSVLVIETARHFILVVVDLARNVRAVRQSLSIQEQGG